MGIDPGLASTGVGIIEEKSPEGWRILSQEDVGTSRRQALPERLEKIYKLVVRGIEDYQPDVVAVESIFFAQNVRSAVMMAHGRGAALLAASNHGIQIAEYSPLEIKQSVVGKGRANKEQVRQMVTTLLELPSPPRTEHRADALACALCHAFRFRSVAGRAQAQAARGRGDGEADPRKELLALSFKRSRTRRKR